jgi:magnesium-protoporphyrin O-methyltransferase
MANSHTYLDRRAQLETYFDRTASATWAALTSDAKVSRIRETVRAGRDAMRARLLDWLPEDLTGLRLLDAGCGTGMLSQAAAERGATVVGVDLAASLLDVARERIGAIEGQGSIEFIAGDFLDPALGDFDIVVAMDSLIHYERDDIVAALHSLSERTRYGILFTFAPRTPALTVLHSVGKLFPRKDRAPAIAPVGEQALVDAMAQRPAIANAFAPRRTVRISSGFYKSQAMELIRA